MANTTDMKSYIETTKNTLGDINKLAQDGKSMVSDFIDEAKSSFSIFTKGNGGGNITAPGTKTKVKQAPQGNKTEISNIWGLPPFAYLEGQDDKSLKYTINKILQTMLVVTLEPCIPAYKGIDGDVGLDLYKLQDIPSSGPGSLTNLLEGTGIKPLTMPLKLAVQNESNFTESWSNQFGESKSESIANVGSSLGQEIRFISGKNSISDGLGEIMKDLGEVGGILFGDTAANVMNSGASRMAEAGKRLENGIEGSSPLGAGLIKAAAGSKIDFPQIWQGCEFSPSYQFTVRLYNPYPNDNKAYETYVLTPLAHLLLFVCPASDSNFTFGFPLLCRMKCPGIAGLDAAYVQQIDVIKGGSGESADISYTQRPGTIDVRFTVTSLYNSMVARGNEDVTEERPALDTYIRDLRGSMEIPSTISEEGTAQDSNNNQIVNLGDIGLSRNNIKSPGFTRDSIFTSSVDLIDIGLNTVRTGLDTIDAFSDPLITQILGANELLTDFNIDIMGKYKNEYEAFKLERELSDTVVTMQDRVALKLKSGLPVPRELSNWFWNNIDTFDTLTKGLVKELEEPGIEPKIAGNNFDMGSFQSSYTLSSKVPAIQTSTF